MQRPCDECGYHNERKHQICRSCGHIIEEIEEVAPPKPRAPAPEPEPVVERRTRVVATSPPPARTAPPPPPARERETVEDEPNAPRARTRRFRSWKRRRAQGDTKKIRGWTVIAVIAFMLLVQMCSD